MEFQSDYERSHQHHEHETQEEERTDGPNYKKTKIENEANGHVSPARVSLSPIEADELFILDQPQSIFRQVSNSTKLPKTAFVIFLNATKDAYYEQHPNASFKDFQTDSLTIWHSLPVSEKNIWLQRETDSRKQFFHQVQDLIDINPPLVPGEDKKPLPTSKLAFPTFVQAMRDQVLLENPTFTYNEIQKELSKAWKNMSRDEKRIWANAELDTPLPSTTKKASYPKRSSALPIPPKSAYSLFYQCARKQLIVEFPDLSGKEIPSVCSELWKNLPSAERALWQADAENDRLRYQRECAVLAQESESVNDKLSALEKPSFESNNESSISFPLDERSRTSAMTGTRRKYTKPPKKEKIDNQPKARKSSKKQISDLTSRPFPENGFFHPSLNSLQSSHHMNGDSLPPDDDPLKMPIQDGLFEDSLAFDTNFFFDSDPFQADLDLFTGLSSPTNNRHQDSKPFLHEDLSLFGNESSSSFPF